MLCDILSNFGCCNFTRYCCWPPRADSWFRMCRVKTGTSGGATRRGLFASIEKRKKEKKCKIPPFFCDGVAVIIVHGGRALLLLINNSVGENSPMTSQSPKRDAAPLASGPKHVDNPGTSEGERRSFLGRPLRLTGGALANTGTGCNLCVEVHFDEFVRQQEGGGATLTATTTKRSAAPSQTTFVCRSDGLRCVDNHLSWL